jgi:hypothetical protein
MSQSNEKWVGGGWSVNKLKWEREREKKKTNFLFHWEIKLEFKNSMM